MADDDEAQGRPQGQGAARARPRPAARGDRRCGHGRRARSGGSACRRTSRSRKARRPRPPEDPEVVAVRERARRRSRRSIRRCSNRIAAAPSPHDELLKFRSTIELHVDPSIALFDHGDGRPRLHAAPSRARSRSPRRSRTISRTARRRRCCATSTAPSSSSRSVRGRRRCRRATRRYRRRGRRRDGHQLEAAAARAIAVPRGEPSVLDELRIERKRPWPALSSRKPLPNRRVQE